MMIAWTTVENSDQAEALARGLIATRHAVCVQIEGPIRSVYPWAGEIAQGTEYRLMIKFLSAHSQAVERWILAHHPYETPEWIVVPIKYVAEKYLSWAQANSSSLAFNASNEPL
jgi:periplasmic divalent cation tolerance protein